MRGWSGIHERRKEASSRSAVVGGAGMLYDPSLNCDEQSTLSDIAQQAARHEQRRNLEQAYQHELRSLTTAADIAQRLAKIEAEKPASAPVHASDPASLSEPADPACSWISRSKASLSKLAGKLGMGRPAAAAAAAATVTSAQQVGPDASRSTSAARRQQAPAKALSGMSPPVARTVPGGRPTPSSQQQQAPAAGPAPPPFLPPLLPQVPPLLMLSMLRRNSPLTYRYLEMSDEGGTRADCDLLGDEEGAPRQQQSNGVRGDPCQPEPAPAQQHDHHHQQQQQQRSKGFRGAQFQQESASAQRQPSVSCTPPPQSPPNLSLLLPALLITACPDPREPRCMTSPDPRSVRLPTGSLASTLLLSSTCTAGGIDDLILSSQPSSASAGSATIPSLPPIFSDRSRSTAPSVLSAVSAAAVAVAAAAAGSINSTARRSLPSPEQQQQQRREGRVTPSWRELIVAGRARRNSATPNSVLLHDDLEALAGAARGSSSAHRLHRSVTAL